MAKKIDFDKIAKKIEHIADIINTIMQNRLIIAIFLIVDGITFICNPNESLPGMARNILLLVILASFTTLITNLAVRKKDIKTIIISLIIFILGIIFHIYPYLISAYIQLLLSLFIIFDGLMNILKSLNLNKYINAITKRYNIINNKSNGKKLTKEKEEQKEKFKEIDKNLNEGMEQQKDKLITPLKNIVNKTNKFPILYLIANIATVILGIILLIFPNTSMVIWGIIFLYTGISNLFVAIKTMNLSKKIKEKKFKEILFDDKKDIKK